MATRSKNFLAREGKGMARQLPRAKIVERIDHTPDLMTIFLEPSEKLAFEPGQYCTIGIDDGAGGVQFPRPYSIVSAPEEDLIELFIEFVPSPKGNLTPKLFELRAGDAVVLYPKAKGTKLRFKSTHRNHVMVATVTGIAPFVSILRQQLYGGTIGDHRFLVLQGASYQDEFGYREELERLAAFSTVHYTPTISRPVEDRNAGWPGQVTRVRVNYLAEELLRTFNLFGFTPDTTVLYLCGNPDMIEYVNERAAPLGYPVRIEEYW